MTEKLYLNKEWLYDQYVTQCKSTKDIANEFNYNDRLIKTWIKKYNIKKPVAYYDNYYYLYYQYVTCANSIKDISEICSVSQSTIYTLLKKFNITRRTNKESQLVRYGYINNIKNKDILFNKYCVEHKSTFEIARELNSDAQTINRWLIEFNIPLRDSKERIELVYEKSEKYKNTKHEYYSLYTNNYKYINPTIAAQLGYIYADGSVMSNRNIVKLGLNILDIEILDYFNAEYHYNTVSYYYRKNNSAYMSICSKIMKHDLCLLGILPNKTYVDYDIDWLNNTSVENMASFCYGFVIGDGCISKTTRNIHLAAHISSERFLTTFLKKLCNEQFSYYYNKTKTAVFYHLNSKYTVFLADIANDLINNNQLPIFLNRKYDLLVSKLKRANYYV